MLKPNLRKIIFLNIFFALFGTFWKPNISKKFKGKCEGNKKLRKIKNRFGLCFALEKFEGKC